MTNPYAAPKEFSEPPPTSPQEVPPATSFVNSLARWTVVCGISAISSFILGLEGRSNLSLVAAMVSGIVVFAVAYAFVDRKLFWRKLMADPVTRNSIYWAYGLRMAASIIYPIGIINDMFAFMLFGGFLMMPFAFLFGNAEPPVSTFFMTITQGIALNVQMAIAVGTISILRKFFGRNLSNSAVSTQPKP